MNDERTAEAIDHLQAAAREMIQAARAILDVFEELVDDPDRVARAVESMGSLADLASRAGGRNSALTGDDAGVERITVS